MASKKILIQVDITTKAAEANVNKVINNLKGVEDATVNVSKATKKLKTDTGLNNAILLETGRLASDASFGFGAMAKDGGKIVKTETGGKAVRPKKIKRIQIKGFGKARK